MRRHAQGIALRGSLGSSRSASACPREESVTSHNSTRHGTDEKTRQLTHRSLQVLPLDLDAVGFEVLAKDPQTLLMLREMYLERLDDNLTVDDFEDWRDIWPWRNYDQPGQGGTSDESDADESDEDESDDDT